MGWRLELDEGLYAFSMDALIITMEKHMFKRTKFLIFLLTLLLLVSCSSVTMSPLSGEVSPSVNTQPSASTPPFESTLPPASTPQSTSTPPINAALPVTEVDTNILDYAFYISNYSLYRKNSQDGELLICLYDNPYIISEQEVFFANADGIFSVDESGMYQELFEGIAYALSENSGWLYFCNENGVFKMRTDGTDLSQIATDFSYRLAAVEDYVFFAKYEPPDFWEFTDDGPPSPAGKLVRMNLDGTDYRELDIWITRLSVFNGNVYYIDANQSYTNGLYMITPHSLDIFTIYKSETFIDQMYVSDGYAYITEFRSIARVSLTDNTFAMLRNIGSNRIIDILNGIIYFNDSVLIDTNTSYYGLAKMNIDGSGFEEIT